MSDDTLGAGCCGVMVLVAMCFALGLLLTILGSR